MKIFDSHTHLNDKTFGNEVSDYVEHAKRLGVVRMANVGSNTQLNERAIKLAHEYPEMSAIVGWHPEDANHYDKAAEELLQKQLDDSQVVALGEIGMDLHQQNTSKQTQEHVFRRQIQIAKNMHLPISVHNRDAFEDTYRILKDEHIEDVGGIIHSFNGDVEWMKKFLDLGMDLSYSGVVSFKKTKEVHEAARQTPMDRILVETDAPYLAPEPLRGHQNEPAYTLYTLEAVARFKDVNPDEIAQATYTNTNRIFGLDE
ncbi:hydrolase TatD [Fructilactobacillus lindneri]|uniref:Deoxyribonuclease YabD n=2 Tax=Fructilactobacillus lindneri TaxID=53444 RepID=A0A0R2K2P9_9LACO|nr:TatD family hydrolase [Fructilactobacillus lindneri]ANZ57353.1 hydrolase TatD [Fructilactobacillus lindneri]ANZ58618.1 hydrolase TatD [Fructilactobacillus lindneri]KRN80711.1 deoxyribonuclease YabD [Fructilactobacillus lindneri DSM 20690 = JCM 11027]POG97656.1 hydrolase TatD [Fructilactobacillus lindneri]POG98993.1 hydrolase TatD [Fructilactobacillus lindneri]